MRIHSLKANLQPFYSQGKFYSLNIHSFHVPPRGLKYVKEFFVIIAGIVMEKNQMLNIPICRKIYRHTKGAVAPIELLYGFVQGVLGINDNKIRALKIRGIFLISDKISHG